jgi:hypothetical protein
MTDKNRDSDHLTPDWLKTIQLNSWEAELLISALVLFALFQIPDIITQFSLQNFPNGSLFHRFFRIITLSIELLKLGYTLHILIRGMWVASVGLSYVFPEGINKDRLRFKGRFAKELESKKSPINNVLRLEEMSSIIYGVTFLLAGTFLGFGLLVFIFILVTEALGPLMFENPAWFLFYFSFFFLYFIIIVLLLIDFLTNGLFRRIDWMAAWFYPLAVVFRVLTLSFLYRRSLLVLISNTKGWKSFLIPAILFIVCGSFLIIKDEVKDNARDSYWDAIQSNNMLLDNYENLRSEDDHVVATIQSDIVSENALRLFMIDLGLNNTFYKDESSRGREWEMLSTDSSSLLLNKWLNIEIDSIRYDKVQWFKTQHPTTLDFGFITHLDLTLLDQGPHDLKIRVDRSQIGDLGKIRLQNELKGKEYISNIHFFYDKK